MLRATMRINSEYSDKSIQVNFISFCYGIGNASSSYLSYWHSREY